MTTINEKQWPGRQERMKERNAEDEYFSDGEDSQEEGQPIVESYDPHDDDDDSDSDGDLFRASYKACARLAGKNE